MPPLSKPIEWNLRFIAFTLPFQIVGIEAGGYPFSLTVIALGSLNTLILLRGRFSRRILAVWGAFIAWCLITTVLRHPPSSYLMSLLGLILMTLPVCATYPWKISKEAVLNALLWGAIASFVLAVYEIGVAIGGMTPFEDVAPLSIRPKAGEYLGFRRVKAGMEEPAHYAIYLVFVYALVDQAQERGINLSWGRVLKWSVPVFLLTTLSLSGIILFASYVAGKTVSGLREIIAIRSWSYTGLFLLSLPLLLLGLIYVVNISGLQEIISLYSRRLVTIVDVVADGTFAGTEGSRANAIPVMVNYWSNHSWTQFFMGEGYANYQGWLTQNFGHLNPLTSTYARGEIPNIFAAVGISTGVIGLAIYLIFLSALLLRSLFCIPASIVVVWLFMHLAYGVLIGVIPWTIIILSYIIFRNNLH